VVESLSRMREALRWILAPQKLSIFEMNFFFLISQVTLILINICTIFSLSGFELRALLLPGALPLEPCPQPFLL
jgi:hypothetical protein